MKIGPSEDGEIRKVLQEEFFWTPEYCQRVVEEIVSLAVVW